MKKKILQLFIGILLILVGVCVVIGGTFFYQGYGRYRETVEQEPIIEAVHKYTDVDAFTEYSEIDPDFVHAVVSLEDKRYFERDGFDWIALARAVINNVIYQRTVEGGSTITQQIAKNLYYQSTRRGIKEKIAEVFLMIDLENDYSKEELFALYANMNYYGDGYWGISNAADGYYGVYASNLTIAQAAILSGIPNAPGAYQLSTGFQYAKERQEKALGLMLKNEYITEEEYQEALIEDVSPLQTRQIK